MAWDLRCFVLWNTRPHRTAALSIPKQLIRALKGVFATLTAHDKMAEKKNPACFNQYIALEINYLAAGIQFVILSFAQYQVSPLATALQICSIFEGKFGGSIFCKYGCFWTTEPVGT